jgi:hypothetical protein
MEPLTNFIKNGFHYQLVTRKGDWAIFKQCLNKPLLESDPSKGMAWEVFKIHVSKEAEMLVKNVEGKEILIKFEPKECGPSNEDFGRHNAWSCPSLSRAYEKLEEAMLNEQVNKDRREARSK